MKDKRQKRVGGGRAALAVAAIALVFIAACKKSESAKTVEKVDFRFSNNVPEPLHVDIYNTRGDYYDNRSPVASADLSLNGEHTFTSLNSGQEYYIDWYSPDFNYNNWYNGPGIPSLEVGFTPTAANTYAQINHLSQIDYSRKLLIGGNGTASNWRAVAAYKGTVYFWDSLSTAGKSKQLAFSKNFTGAYYYLGDGKLNAAPMSFAPDSRNSSQPDVSCPLVSTDGHGTIGTLRSITTGGYTARDSVKVTFQSSPELYFIMKRD